MEIAGYVAAVLIGLSLGLIGGGGSILTVPVLVYLFGVSPGEAISYSLFIVGSTSLVGAGRKYANGEVHIKTALLFGLTSIATVLLTRLYLVPAIPKTIFTLGKITITKDFLTMVLFAALMLFSSVSMIRNKRQMAEKKPSKNIGLLVVYGILIGLVTGFLGAGGGFLLIPALVFFVRLDMKTAVGTSLMIIAMNSLIGFLGDIGTHNIRWTFLLTITAIAVLGIILGIALSKKVPGAKLKKGFGWFVLLMGTYILLAELLNM